MADTSKSRSRLTSGDLISSLTLHLPPGEMIEHVIAVVATVSYNDRGEPSSRVHRMYPNGGVNGYTERGILHDALRQSEREADRAG